MGRRGCTITTARRWFSRLIKCTFAPRTIFASSSLISSIFRRHLDYISNWKGNIYSRRHHDVEVHPKDVERKVYLLKYFDEYMSQTLKREVEWTFSDVGRTKNMDFLVKYYRMKNAIVFKMSNEVLQVSPWRPSLRSCLAKLASRVAVQLLRPHQTPPHPKRHRHHLHRRRLQPPLLLSRHPLPRSSPPRLLPLEAASRAGPEARKATRFDEARHLQARVLPRRPSHA